MAHKIQQDDVTEQYLNLISVDGHCFDIKLDTIPLKIIEFLNQGEFVFISDQSDMLSDLSESLSSIKCINIVDLMEKAITKGASFVQPIDVNLESIAANFFRSKSATIGSIENNSTSYSRANLLNIHLPVRAFRKSMININEKPLQQNQVLSNNQRPFKFDPPNLLFSSHNYCNPTTVQSSNANHSSSSGFWIDTKRTKRHTLLSNPNMMGNLKFSTTIASKPLYKTNSPSAIQKQVGKDDNESKFYEFLGMINREFIGRFKAYKVRKFDENHEIFYNHFADELPNAIPGLLYREVVVFRQRLRMAINKLIIRNYELPLPAK